MKPFPLEPSINATSHGTNVDEGRQWNSERPEIVFDDQLLECILYGHAEEAPIAASLFGRARKLVRLVREAERERDVGTVIERCKNLAADDLSISLELCFELAEVLTTIVPQYPNPVLPFDLAPLCPLLDKMWAMALEKQNNALQGSMATPTFRCYEHCGQYEKARHVLRWLLESSRQHGQRFDEAVVLNNLAFEYLLEGRYQEALVGFEEAANLFQALGSAEQSANSRANYWICQFESSDPGDVDQIETELKDLEEILTRSESWQTRKPMILLARISEQRGDLKDSMCWVEKAIQACQGTGTRYPETDAQYLLRLKATSQSREKSVP